MNGSTVVEDLTAIPANTVLAIEAHGNEGYIVDEITVIGSTLNTTDNTFCLTGNTTVTVTFKEGTLPSVSYQTPSGNMHSAGNTYVEQIYTENAITNIDKSWEVAPNNVYQLVDQTVLAKQGTIFNLHLNAKSLGESSTTQVHQDMRYNAAVIFVDWDRDGEFEQLEKIGLTPPSHNVTGNMDVLEINQSIAVPVTASLGETRIRVIYNNAWQGEYWSAPDANTQNIVEGMAYDIPVVVNSYLAINKVPDNDVQLYYANDKIYANIKGEIAIYDLSGKLVRYEHLASIEVADLAPGTYIVRVKGKSLKFVK